MTDNNSDPLPVGTVDAIGKAAAHNQSNAALPDQIPHSRRLREVGFNGAVSAIRDYKQHHPDAAGYMTRIETLAYKPKPSGYPQFIDGIVDSWLSGADNCKQTNRAIISRISDRFPEYKFSKDLLNKPLSKAMANRIKAKAAERGFIVDTRQHDTLSKIKAATHKGEIRKALTNSGRIALDVSVTQSHVGHIKIEQHRQQQTLRFRRPDGTQRRIAVADLKTLADLFAESQLRSDTLSSVYTVEICDPIAENPQNSVGLYLSEATPPENISAICDPASQSEPTMTERIAALRAGMSPASEPRHPPGYDPLCHL